MYEFSYPKSLTNLSHFQNMGGNLFLWIAEFKILKKTNKDKPNRMTLSQNFVVNHEVKFIFTKLLTS